MDKPTSMVKNPAINQPYVVATGPPKVRPVLYKVVIPVMTDMIEKEKAKFDNTLQISDNQNHHPRFTNKEEKS